MHGYPSFALTVEPQRDHVRVVAVGDIDMSTAPALAAQLDELYAAGWAEVAVDLSEVTFIDSTAIHVLVDTQRRVAMRGADLWILDASDIVMRVLELTGVEELLRRTPTSV